MLPHFSHDRPIWSSPFFTSTTLRNFPGISDLISEVSKFQHHTKLCPKRSTSLPSFFLKFKSNLLVKGVDLLNAAFAITILHLMLTETQFCSKMSHAKHIYTLRGSQANYMFQNFLRSSQTLNWSRNFMPSMKPKCQLEAENRILLNRTLSQLTPADPSHHTLS